MDRCIRYADTDLIWTERLRWAVFDAKHLRRLADFVVNDSSHPKLQRPNSRMLLPPYLPRFSDAIYVIVAAISDIRPRVGGGQSLRGVHGPRQNQP